MEAAPCPETILPLKLSCLFPVSLVKLMCPLNGIAETRMLPTEFSRQQFCFEHSRPFPAAKAGPSYLFRQNHNIKAKPAAQNPKKH